MCIHGNKRIFPLLMLMQCCWYDGHRNRRWRDDGHLEPRFQHRDQRHRDGKQPGTGGHGRRGGRAAPQRSAGRLPRRRHPLILSSALAPLMFLVVL
uniref:Uncharacterized protein n=1 Tax=Arundo donax TaxID=35708 RepID=A0A0A9HAY0_ARUDO